MFKPKVGQCWSESPPRIDFVFEPQQDQMAGLVGAKTGDLDVVVEQVGVLGHLVVPAREELFLKIKARTPGEVAADLEILALAMAVHVLSEHALARSGIMGATGGMDVMIAGPPAKLRWVEPTP